MKGYIQIYTGNGKGKTTACLGLLLRALGADRKVYFCQFLKDDNYCEIKMLKTIAADLGKALEIKQWGVKRRVSTYFSAEDKAIALKGFEALKAAILSDKYDLVIADELNVALHYALIPLDEVLALLSRKPAALEIVITGRNAKDELIKIADLVTEMKEIKHYFAQGVIARKGIEF